LTPEIVVDAPVLLPGLDELLVPEPEPQALTRRATIASAMVAQRNRRVVLNELVLTVTSPLGP
jgi:hypothetical protein